MGPLEKVVGRDGLHRSRLHDEKGNVVGPLALLGLPVAVAVRVSQRLTDHPYLPWIPLPVIRRLKHVLNPGSRVLEFGSGRSTRWLAAHAGHVVSIEDDLVWYEKMSSVLASAGLTNVDYRLRQGPDYYDVSGLAGPFDLVIVDGVERGRCVQAAAPLVARGGYIYLDDSDKDMTLSDGRAVAGGESMQLRLAEETMKQTAEAWAAEPEYFLGYPPGTLFPHQGLLLRRPALGAVCE